MCIQFRRFRNANVKLEVRGGEFRTGNANCREIKKSLIPFFFFGDSEFANENSEIILEEMVSSASPCSLTRSSLEEMLDSLRRKDEGEANKKDSPPALPSRPASKARLPRAKRSLPNNFKVGSGGGVVKNGFNDNEESVESKRKETCLENKIRESSFGRKRVKKDVVESPYVAPICESGIVSELDGDTISYFIKMVTLNLEK